MGIAIAANVIGVTDTVITVREPAVSHAVRPED